MNLIGLAASKKWPFSFLYRPFLRPAPALVSVLVIYMTGAVVSPALGETLQTRAQVAAVADGASTLGALALGASESNPLGLAALALKVPMLSYIASLPEAEQADGYAMQASVWGAAAANNLCVVAAIVTGGTFAPVCLVAGAAWGMREWSQSSEEREFWDICRQWRLTQPEMRCTYKKPADRVRPVPAMQSASNDALGRDESVEHGEQFGSNALVVTVGLKR